MGTQYKSLLGLTEVIADSAEISNIDLEATNITGLTTSRIPEGYNLYYTDARVSENPNVSSNSMHRERKDNPHGVTAAQVGIEDTDDIIEGHINLYYTDIRFDDRLATKTTTSLAEGSNLYYTDARFDARFGIKTTSDLTEGANLYYTDARFDTRLATKTTTNLTEEANLYYTDARFDTRFGIKSTTDLTEGTNLYYTTTRANADFDARFGIKTTDNLTEGFNLYYTDARFDARLATKTTTDLTEGANLYYTTTRANADFDARFGIKTTDNLTEGSNLYYTDTRVSANADVKANTAYRNTGHLPLSGGTLTGDLNMGNQNIINSNSLTIGASTRKINITGGIEITGVGNTADGSHVTYFTTTDDYPLLQNLNFTHNAVYLTFDGYYDFKAWKKSHSTATFQISKEYDQLNFNVWNTGAAGSSMAIQNSHAMIIDANKWVKIYNGLDVTGNITISGTVDGVDVEVLNTTVNNHIENTNNPHGVLATQITDFDTEVSANADVKANTAYRNTGHLPLSGGTLTGDLNTLASIKFESGNTTYPTPAEAIPGWVYSNTTAFNKVDSEYGIIGQPYGGTYSGTKFTTVSGIGDIYGEWYQIKTPEPTTLTRYGVWGGSNGGSRTPKTWYVVVSMDEVNWTSVAYVADNSAWNAYTKRNFSVNTSGVEAMYFRLIITADRGDLYLQFSEFAPVFSSIGHVSLNIQPALKSVVDFTLPPALPTSGNELLQVDEAGAITLNSTLIADVKTNSEYTSIGHLPLTGGTLTGDLSINGELNIGGEKITTGATNGLQLYGPVQTISAALISKPLYLQTIIPFFNNLIILMEVSPCVSTLTPMVLHGSRLAILTQ